MKKSYSKPEIMFESFALSENIAGTCEVKTNNPSQSTCGLNMSGMIVFLDTMTGCSGYQVISNGGDGEFNGVCYHVPQGDNLFNS